MKLLAGCDFSSTPSQRKPIVIALGRRDDARVQVSELLRLPSLDAFAHWLAQPREWIGGFDFPFGLPRELVTQLGWPLEWQACMLHYAAHSRAEFGRLFDAFRAARPPGSKYAHRATDIPAGASPSMKCANPPVAWMLHAGVPRLIEAGVHIPGLHGGDARRVALEAYPGMLAREILGRRSYKNDARAKQTPERLIARKDLITALEHGQTRLGLRLKLTHAQRDTLADDASGDSLDAVLCLMQATWAERQGAPRYGMPQEVDPLEGWIVSAA